MLIFAEVETAGCLLLLRDFAALLLLLLVGLDMSGLFDEHTLMVMPFGTVVGVAGTVGEEGKDDIVEDFELMKNQTFRVEYGLVSHFFLQIG